MQRIACEQNRSHSPPETVDLRPSLASETALVDAGPRACVRIVRRFTLGLCGMWLGLGAIALATSSTVFDDPVPNHQRWSWVAAWLGLGALGGLSATGLGRHLAATIARDFRNVTRGIESMALGRHFEGDLHLHRSDELGRLRYSFDRLQRHFVAALERHRGARRRAEDADRYKSQFLDSVRHELRNPLNAILGFTDVLLQEIDGALTPAQREDLEVIRDAGTHLTRLFNEALDLSAVTSGTVQLDRSCFDIGPLLREVVREIEPQAQSRGIRVRLDIPTEPLEISADRTRLRQILTNLTHNAAKFTPKGEVIVGALCAQDRLVLEVRDTGIGIPEQSLERIFDEFTQTDREADARRGSGLGLTITRRLVELHGGELRVESRVGQGSTFSVHLPKRAASFAPSVADRYAPPLVATSKAEDPYGPKESSGASHD